MSVILWEHGPPSPATESCLRGFTTVCASTAQREMAELKGLPTPQSRKTTPPFLHLSSVLLGWRKLKREERGEHRSQVPGKWRWARKPPTAGVCICSSWSLLRDLADGFPPSRGLCARGSLLSDSPLDSNTGVTVNTQALSSGGAYGADPLLGLSARTTLTHYNQAGRLSYRQRDREKDSSRTRHKCISAFLRPP